MIILMNESNVLQNLSKELIPLAPKMIGVYIIKNLFPDVS